MAEDRELVELYGELRAQIISRHLAHSRYFCANLLSLENDLGEFPNEAQGGRACNDGLVRCTPSGREDDSRSTHLALEAARDSASSRRRPEAREVGRHVPSSLTLSRSASHDGET